MSRKDSAIGVAESAPKKNVDMTREELFTVPVETGGNVVCFRPADRVYVLEFESPPDNRLTTVRIHATQVIHQQCLHSDIPGFAIAASCVRTAPLLQRTSNAARD